MPGKSPLSWQRSATLVLPNWLMPVVVQTVDELGLVRCTTYSVPAGWVPGFDQLMFTEVDDASTALGLTATKLAADAAAGLELSVV